MFVTSLFDEWWKNLERLRLTSQNDSQRNGDDVSTYDDFLERQKDVWTPSEIYQKCCPRFLAGNISHRRKSGQFVCFGGCRKIHPIITLYFDPDKNCTIATLSCRLDPFKKYFDKRVNEGSGVWKSPVYCELNGFLRENLRQLRHEQRLFGGHLVKVAIGALEASDAAHGLLLEETHLKEHRRRHGRSPTRCDDSRDAVNTFNCNTKSFPCEKIERLEMALEICRLWGLGENLDVLSLDCMSRTSHVFRKIATPIIEQRVKECEFVVTPLVDGHVISGRSVFRRGYSDRQTIYEKEQDRLVEYAMCSSVLYRRQQEEEETHVKKTNGGCKRGRFLPADCSYSSKSEDENDSKGEDCIGFSWACEELSYANLELEFMDIGVPEYVGQKVIVQWKRSDADIPDETHQHHEEIVHDSSSSSLSSSTGIELPVFRLKLDRAPQKTGTMNLSVPHFDLKLAIRNTCVSQLDDVTFSYSGDAQVLECKADFAFLVAAYARSLEPCLKAEYQKIETTRPLLRHEREFGKEVQSAASSSPMSSYIWKI